MTSSKLLSLVALFAWASHSWAAGTCAKAPAQMRAARVHAAGGPEALRVEQVPTPAPAAGEVLWIGAGALGRDDGKVALFRPDQLPLLAPAASTMGPAAGATQGRARKYSLSISTL